MEDQAKSLSAVMHNRHSVRKYDPEFKIQRSEIEEILTEAATAPSSSNLQPWRFLVIEDQEVKKELRAIANNQEQVETASAIIAVIGNLEMYKDAEKIYGMNVEAGFMDEATKNQIVGNISNVYPKAPRAELKSVAAFDAGLISMQLMLIAKARGYDTVTMGGFDKAKFTERFELPENQTPFVLIALGKAASPSYKTTRLPLSDITTFI
ncbi:nitroreductase family protein [Bacillus massiliglaciei]|uniref:nitroreductase family protein n=1 Tax=Bacillus massiliglaciei TaxID=1816693 RepID=UPI000AEA88E3|nr:nitroreductase family protein [Bacillus massiliglaciei]